jgi:hypothetical protein
MRVLLLGAAIAAMVCLPAAPALAGPADAVIGSFPGCSIEASRPGPWSVEFGASPNRPALSAPPGSLAADGQAPPPRRPVPVEYSEGYKTRAKIHKIASIATLPLFITDYALGQQLYNNPGDESKKGVHAGFAAATGILFGVNSVTGVWNLWEGRKDPNHRTRRMTHAILMLAADAGFLATAMLAPEGEEHHESGNPDLSSQRSTHRGVAIASMSVATLGYLIMLFGAH